MHLQAQDLLSPDKLNAAVDAAGTEAREACSRYDAAAAKVEDKKAMLEAMDNYRNTYPVIREYRAIRKEKDKQKFYAAYEANFIINDAAKRQLDKLAHPNSFRSAWMSLRRFSRSCPRKTSATTITARKATACTIHFIRTEIVRDLILDALRNVATYARANKEDFEQLVMQTTSDARKRSLQSGRTELDRIMRRTNELDTLLQKLYEDYALGRLPEKRHAKLSAQYEEEQAQLEQRSAELMEQMNAEQEESVNVDRFMELVDRYTDFTDAQ